MQASRIFPFLTCVPLTKVLVKSDIIVGITVVFFLVPQSMSYAELAGMPAYYGLYAGFVPVILSGLFGHLPQLGTGPVALTSLMTASVLLAIGGEMYTPNYIELAILLAFLVGIIRIIMGSCRLASLLHLIPHPVIISFANAGLLIICLSQIPKLFGIPVTRLDFVTFLTNSTNLISILSAVNKVSLLFGLSAIAGILLIKHFFPRAPAALIVLILSINISYGIDYHQVYGGAIVGYIPSGLPEFKIPGWNWSNPHSSSLFATVLTLIPGAIVLILVSSMEMLAISKAIRMKTHHPINLNHELIAQGISAIGGSCAQSYPTSVSFSRSSFNLEYGAKTGLCSIVTGIAMMSVLFLFTPTLYHLPRTTLAALIIVSVIRLMHLPVLFRAWKVKRQDGIIAGITFISTLLFVPHIIYGILAGITLSLFVYGYKRYNQGRYAQLNLTIKTDPSLPDSLFIHLEGQLLFTGIARIEKDVLAVMNRSKPITHIFFVMDKLDDIDASGEWGLLSLVEQLRIQRIKIAFIGLSQHINHCFNSTGLKRTIGSENIYSKLPNALKPLQKA